jgi:hypothetical protein
VDFVFLQETLHTAPDSCLLLEGFVGHHTLASVTGGRPSQGLSSFFRIEAFADGCLSRLTTVVDWILVTRWAKPMSPGLLFINVYIPLHSGVTNEDLDKLRTTVHGLQRSYPGDLIIMGGDFNLDPWRCQDRRAERVPMTPQTRHLEALVESLSRIFNRFPSH